MTTTAHPNIRPVQLAGGRVLALAALRPPLALDAGSVVGKYGDEGKYVTLESGHVIFITDRSGFVPKHLRAGDAEAKRFTRAGLEKALIDHHEQMGGGFTDHDDATEASLQAPFVFRGRHGKLPEEIGRHLDASPAMKRVVRLARPGEVAGGEDAMAQLGEDRYLSLLKNKTTGRLTAAKATATASDDPEISFLSAIHDHLPGGRGKVTAVKPGELRVGTKFTIHGNAFRVAEDDQGHRVLQGGVDFPSTPLDALRSVPVDVGSFRQGRAAKGDSYEGAGRMIRRAKVAPADDIPFGGAEPTGRMLALSSGRVLSLAAGGYVKGRDGAMVRFRTIDDRVVPFVDSDPNADPATRAAYHRQQARSHRFLAEKIAERANKADQAGRKVPHLTEANGVADLSAHYADKGGEITQDGNGFKVRLPAQKRIHRYDIDTDPRSTGKPFKFAGEGFYDQYSPDYREPTNAPSASPDRVRAEAYAGVADQHDAAAAHHDAAAKAGHAASGKPTPAVPIPAAATTSPQHEAAAAHHAARAADTAGKASDLHREAAARHAKAAVTLRASAGSPAARLASSSARQGSRNAEAAEKPALAPAARPPVELRTPQGISTVESRFGADAPTHPNAIMGRVKAGDTVKVNGKLTHVDAVRSTTERQQGPKGPVDQHLITTTVEGRDVATGAKVSHRFTGEHAIARPPTLAPDSVGGTREPAASADSAVVAHESAATRHLAEAAKGGIAAAPHRKAAELHAAAAKMAGATEAKPVQVVAVRRAEPINDPTAPDYKLTGIAGRLAALESSHSVLKAETADSIADHLAAAQYHETSGSYGDAEDRERAAHAALLHRQAANSLAAKGKASGGGTDSKNAREASKLVHGHVGIDYSPKAVAAANADYASRKEELTSGQPVRAIRYDADAAGTSGVKPGLFGQPTVDPVTRGTTPGLFPDRGAAPASLPKTTAADAKIAAKFDPTATPMLPLAPAAAPAVAGLTPPEPAAYTAPGWTRHGSFDGADGRRYEVTSRPHGKAGEVEVRRVDAPVMHARATFPTAGNRGYKYVTSSANYQPVHVEPAAGTVGSPEEISRAVVAAKAKIAPAKTEAPDAAAAREAASAESHKYDAPADRPPGVPYGGAKPPAPGATVHQTTLATPEGHTITVTTDRLRDGVYMHQVQAHRRGPDYAVRQMMAPTRQTDASRHDAATRHVALVQKYRAAMVKKGHTIVGDVRPPASPPPAPYVPPKYANVFDAVHKIHGSRPMDGSGLSMAARSGGRVLALAAVRVDRDVLRVPLALAAAGGGPPLSRCPACGSADVDRTARPSGGRSVDACRHCGHRWTHTPGTVTVDQHTPEPGFDADGFATDQDLPF